MANKQINELTEKTSMIDADLIPIYDSEEAGSEKTKKITISNVKASIPVWNSITFVFVDDEDSTGSLSCTFKDAAGNAISQYVSGLMYCSYAANGSTSELITTITATTGDLNLVDIAHLRNWRYITNSSGVLAIDLTSPGNPFALIFEHPATGAIISSGLMEITGGA